MALTERARGCARQPAGDAATRARRAAKNACRPCAAGPAAGRRPGRRPAGRSPAAGAPLALPAPPQSRAGAAPRRRDTARRHAARAATAARSRCAPCSPASAPVVLVPGYYRCPRLCGLVMQGVLEALRAERPAGGRLAHRRLQHRPAATRRPTRAAARPTLRLRRVRGSTRQRCRGAGRPAPADQPGRDSQRSPQRSATLRTRRRRTTALRRRAYRAQRRLRGRHARRPRVARYFPGVRFDAGARCGWRWSTPPAGASVRSSERLTLLCAHFDPRQPDATAVAMHGLAACAARFGRWRWRCGLASAVPRGSAGRPRRPGHERAPATLGSATGLHLLVQGASSIAGDARHACSAPCCCCAARGARCWPC